MKKSKIIKFGKIKSEFYDLKPMKSSIPQWYKDAPTYIENQNMWNKYGLKQCVPFLDTLTTGYLVPLPVDVYVETKADGDPFFSWADSTFETIIHRPEPHPFPPILPGFSDMKLLWALPLAIELPKGYSALFTHPLNRFDLPFYTLSGIVDSFKMYGGNVPFLFKQGFEGIIPAGTPILQIIPFKTENWKREETPSLVQESLIIRQRSRNVLSHFYKTNFWNRKTYE